MNVSPRHIVLVGLMGSGKTTVGRRVAARLGWPFLDSDDVIEARTGRTVREIWRSDGEAAFRALEAEALVDSLASETPTVIAAAGGVVLSELNRTALTDADAVVVWLRADPAALVERASSGAHRPLLDDDPAAALRQMATERDDLYEQVSDVDVDAEQPVDDVVADVVAAVRP